MKQHYTAQKIADLVTFTEEILKEKLNFFTGHVVIFINKSMIYLTFSRHLSMFFFFSQFPSVERSAHCIKSSQIKTQLT